MSSFAEWTEEQKKQKKKKKKSAEGVSFTEYTKQVLEKDDIESPLSEGEDDIAPVGSTVGRLGGDLSKAERIIFENAAIAAEKKRMEDAMRVRDANFWDLTWNSITKGYNTARYGEESYSAMNGQANDREVYKKILEGKEYRFKPENKFEGAVSGAFELVGQMARQFTHPRTLAVAGGAAGTAAIAGQFGPQVLLPEEIVTVPTAFFAGLAAGNAASALEIEAGHAYNEMIEAGIKEETARKVALAVGTVNAGLEALQVDELLDAFKVTRASGATKTFTKKIINELLDRGVDVAKETGQEVLQEGVTITGVQLANKAETGEWAYSSGEVANRLLDTAESSALSFGMMNVPATVKNTVYTGADQVTTNKLTDNEQKVVDKVVEDEITKREQDGTKLTSKEKLAIKKDVIDQMDKGYISTDTIEEVLGDKSSYDSLAKESEEFDTLYNTASGQLSKAQQDRLAELEAKNKENPYKDALENAKSQYSQSVFELVKGGRLSESYNEKARRSQVFEADLNQYDTKQQETIKRAVESGILNNSRRTHEFVDLIAKVSAEKGVLFDFTNNEKLKESGFAINGKTVNGYFDKTSGTIGLNIDSAKALNTVAGHEITHVLEGTEFYKELQNVLFDYAKSKGEYQSRYDSLTELYKNVKDADVESELTADLVGDYLFTDSDFIARLSTQHRNVAQKIYDEIKYLYRVATAGSKEARELERVKKAFEDAFRGETRNSADGGVKYKLSDLDIDRVNIDYKDTAKANEAVDTKVSDMVKRGKVVPLSNESISKYKESTDWSIRKEVRNLLEGILKPNMGVSVVFEYGDQGAVAYLTSKGINHSVGGLASPKKAAAFEKFSALVKNAEYVYSSPHDEHSNTNKNIDGDILWDTFVAVGTINGEPYPVTFKIRSIDADVRSQIYEMATKNETGFSHEDGTQENPANAHSNYGTSPVSAANVPQDGSGVKGQFSLSDSTGKQLTKEQQDYFKDSVVRDENGNLKVMYHGTSRGGFNIFDTYGSNHGLFGQGSYFTDNKDIAQSYTNKGKGNNKQVYESYLNIKNPIDMDAQADSAQWAKAFDDVDFPESGTNEQFYRAVEEFYADQYMPKWEVAQIIQESIQFGMGYDGITHIGGGRINADGVKHRVYIAFDPEQIKNTDNTKPTEDADIRYSLTEYTAEEKKAHNKAVVDYFGTTYKWAETGYVLLDGSKLDMSGKHEGAPGGYRTVDHRDIVDALGSDYGDDTYSGSLVQFMSEGNIRISPESDGINLSVKPNKAQEQALSDFISRARGEVLLDIDDFDGYTVVSVEYPRGTHANKVLNDIREWFDNGKKPEVSNVSQFRYSVSNKGQKHKRYGNYNVYGKDIRLGDIAPVQETIPQKENVAPVAEAEPIGETAMFPDDLAPIQGELSNLLEEKDALEERLFDLSAKEDFGEEFKNLSEQWDAVNKRVKALEAEMEESESGRIDSLTDTEAPPEMEAPYYGESSTVPDPFAERDMFDVGKRNVKAYMYENPEVKPFFQEAANVMLGDLHSGTKGEKIYNDQLHYDSGGEKGWMGTKRNTTADIADLLDNWNYTYAEIEKGLNAIIEDNGAENNAVSKRIEFMLHDRLVNGYTGVWGEPMPANQEYINFLQEREINEYSGEAFDNFMASADQYVPEYIAPVAKAKPAENIAPVAEKFEAIRPQPKKEPRLARATPEEQARAEILTEEPKTEKKKNGAWSKIKNLVLEKGMVFEDLALKTGNRELQAKWNSIRYAEGKAQKLIGEGNAAVSSLKSMQEQVEQSGKTQQFYEYLYHMHNMDRMNLEGRYDGATNKPVFGNSVTADMSRVAATELAKKNPEFRSWARDIYRYNENLRQMLVDGGVISQETANLWAEMYPHYVPIRRAGDFGLNINVPLDTGRTGVNAPIKRAKGGSRDILPLFDTMAQRTIQTYKAIAKNRFGVELKNTLGTTIANEATSVDEAIDSIDTQDGLLQEGKKGQKPTFTVFENGEKVTFEITDEMYDAMKPTSDILSGTNKVLNTISNIRRGTLTEYNPWFLLKNAVKDVQDILINSQHPGKTYWAIPKAIKEMATNGHYYQEYMDNGGDQNTYFDNESNTFKAENTKLETAKKVFGLDAISKANNIIERLPRLAEYIASREAKQSVDVAMLDAARVTTNFAAGGDLTKFLNRNGATFLNASVQGAMQQARNIREAKVNGLKGWASLAAKYAVAGLPVVLLNHLIWDDDEEYEELSDYVKQNYYIVGKFGDGQFVRIPKGRTVAVIQNAFEQMDNLVTGDDEVDLRSFLDLVVTNLAPNNPLDNNILSPAVDVATNEAWYGGDLVPTRLQDLPAAEQYDESTDAISRWLGETFNVSPYKVNYLLDQYSGVVGDTFLPMLTPEAENGDNSFLGNMIAPLKDMFTTDSVMNNQNVSDFYDLKDELTVVANGTNATDEDKLKAKYMNSIGAEMSELYQQKREIQSGNLPDDKKYEQVRDIQQQIVDLMKEGMDNYQSISYEDDYRGGGEYARVGDLVYKWYEPSEDSDAEPGWQKLSDEQLTKYEVTKAAGDSSYATDGTNHYRWYVPGEDASKDAKSEWRKITSEQLEKQEEVTSGLGISPEDYWGKKEEYDYAYEYPESYAVAKAVGGYESYKTYSSELYDIKADKDSNGKSISGSRKEKVLDYINGLDADYGEKIILFKSEYNADDTYNYEIIDYLNGREDISYEEMETILKKLGFTVLEDGTVKW